MAIKALPILAIAAVSAIALRSKKSVAHTATIIHGVSTSGCHRISIVNKKEFMAYIDSVAKSESKTDNNIFDVSKNIFSKITEGKCFEYPADPKYQAEYITFNKIFQNLMIAFIHYKKVMDIDTLGQDKDNYNDWLSKNSKLINKSAYGSAVLYDDLNNAFVFGLEWIESVMDIVELNGNPTEDELRIKVINSSNFAEHYTGNKINFSDIPDSDEKTEFQRATTCFIRMYRKWLGDKSSAIDISHYIADRYNEFYNCSGLDAPKNTGDFGDFFYSLPYRSADMFIIFTGAYDLIHSKKHSFWGS